MRELWSDRQRLVLAGQTCRTLRQSKGGQPVAANACSKEQSACPQLWQSASALPHQPDRSFIRATVLAGCHCPSDCCGSVLPDALVTVLLHHAYHKQRCTERITSFMSCTCKVC